MKDTLFLKAYLNFLIKKYYQATFIFFQLVSIRQITCYHLYSHSIVAGGLELMS